MLMNVLLVMVDVKCTVQIHQDHLSALVIIMKYWMLQDYSVLVCEHKRFYKWPTSIIHSASDHDECATGAHNCEQDCRNTVPYWSCGCYTGYVLRSDGRTCQGNNLDLKYCIALTNSTH